MSTPTIQELTQAAEQIRLETSNNANTAERVGEALGGIVEYLGENVPEGLDTELTSLDSRLDTAEGKITTAEGNITSLQALAASGYRIAGFIAPNNSYLAKAVEGTCYFVTNPASASWHDSVVGKVYLPPSTYTPSSSAPSSVTGWTSFTITGACIFGYKNGAWSKHDLPFALLTQTDELKTAINRLALNVFSEITDYTIETGAVNANGTRGSGSSYGHGLLAVTPGQMFAIENFSESSDAVRYVFATTNTCDPNATIPKVGDVGIVTHASRAVITIPEGCTYLWWNASGYLSRLYGVDFVNSAGVKETIEKTSEAIVLVGAGNTMAHSSNIHWPKVGNKYRLWVKNPLLPRDEVTYTSSSYNWLYLCAYANGELLSCLVQVPITDSSLSDYYDFVIPEGTDYIRCGTRANTGLEQVLVLEDITSLGEMHEWIKKICYSTGDVIYGTDSITFPVGSAFWYKGMEVGAINSIEFDTETTYEFDSDHTVLIFSNGVISQTSTANLQPSDVVLLMYSLGSKKFVGGELYPEYIEKTNLTRLNNVPFVHGGYTGASSDEVSYTDTTKRLRVELPIDNLAYIRVKGTYKMAAILIGEELPTSVFKTITDTTASANVIIDVPKVCKECVEFVPKKVLFTIANSNTSTDFPDIVSNIDEMVEVTCTTLSESVIDKPRRTVKRFELVKGFISDSGASDGWNTKTSTYIQGYRHTPRFIRMTDDIVIKESRDYGGYVFLYDKDGRCKGHRGLSQIVSNNHTIPKEWGYYIRLNFTSSNGRELPINGIELEGVWDGTEEVFLPRPTDDGFTCLCFPVRINMCQQPDDSVSSITSQYTDSEDHGILHLPESYDPKGRPTPLIIYLHGAAERYDKNSTRFGDNVRYSPEWSAMGYAQLDVDMIPEIYGMTAANTSGTCDDEACVLSAYRWVVEHYNIRRDGVYLFGRSRGGMAVQRILARYNPQKMPVICALSNAGANCVLVYNLFRGNPKTAWWNAFCTSTGLAAFNPPTIGTTSILPRQSSIVSFLRNHLSVWWDKAKVCIPLITDNPTEYQTPEQIFDFLMTSYATVPSDPSTPLGIDFLENFVMKCTFKSPVPLRFDWCVGDTIQTDLTAYGTKGKDAFIQSSKNLYGNCIYREWPTCPEGVEPHYHEKFNLTDGDYTLPNGAVIEDASMAQVEWMLWAMRHDNRKL